MSSQKYRLDKLIYLYVCTYSVPTKVLPQWLLRDGRQPLISSKRKYTYRTPWTFILSPRARASDFVTPLGKKHHGLRSPDPDRPRSNPPKQSHDTFDPETLLCQLRKAQSQVRQGGSVLKLLQEPERVRLSEPGAVAEASQTSGG